MAEQDAAAALALGILQGVDPAALGALPLEAEFQPFNGRTGLQQAIPDAFPHRGTGRPVEP